MVNHKTVHRKKIVCIFILCFCVFILLLIRLIYLMVWEADYYAKLANDLHERERSIKAERGLIVDVNGTVIADNKTVCTVSVIYNQITNPEEVIKILCEELNLSESYVRGRVETWSSMERIKSNVDKEIGDKIRAYDLDGVKVDEDYKRYYPYGELASKVLGFTGSDNQGIIGLEVIYEDYLQGKNGTILTKTDAKGIEIDSAGESRIEPIAGQQLQLSLDINIQSYATQLAKQVMETKQAQSVSIIVMNPQDGGIMAMVDVPEFDLNSPYDIPGGNAGLSNEEIQISLNQIWRNGCISDTYEPGSTFKIITAAAGLEENIVSLSSHFSCPGYIIVDNQKIRCHKTAGHGSQDFTQATMNSCNPAFITIGQNLGVANYYQYFTQFGLLNRTGIDLPGEAGTIMHQEEAMNGVELATVSFGQSFQISPIQMLTTVSTLINGGNRITPHFGISIKDQVGVEVEKLEYPIETNIVSEETSEILQEILEQVVAEGSGINAKIEGYSIGGKTATSQTIPRGNGEYIASFIGFAPADDPQVIAIAIVNRPEGVYYGSQVAAPIIRQLFENILPYLDGIDYNIEDVAF